MVQNNSTLYYNKTDAPDRKNLRGFRYTKGLDIWIELSPDNANKILNEINYNHTHRVLPC